jgi:hypothetical protein
MGDFPLRNRGARRFLSWDHDSPVRHIAKDSWRYTSSLILLLSGSERGLTLRFAHFLSLFPYGSLEDWSIRALGLRNSVEGTIRKYIGL